MKIVLVVKDYRNLRVIGRYFFFQNRWPRPIIHIDLFMVFFSMGVGGGADILFSHVEGFVNTLIVCNCTHLLGKQLCCALRCDRSICLWYLESALINIFFLNFALWDIFLPEDPFPAAYIGFDCYKLQVVDDYRFQF